MQRGRELGTREWPLPFSCSSSCTLFQASLMLICMSPSDATSLEDAFCARTPALCRFDSSKPRYILLHNDRFFWGVCESDFEIWLDRIDFPITFIQFLTLQSLILSFFKYLITRTLCIRYCNVISDTQYWNIVRNLKLVISIEGLKFKLESKLSFVRSAACLYWIFVEQRYLSQMWLDTIRKGPWPILLLQFSKHKEVLYRFNRFLYVFIR